MFSNWKFLPRQAGLQGPRKDNKKRGSCHIGQSVPEAPTGDHHPGPSRMECYSGEEDQPCSSLLGRNTTQAECCCTQGASWGDTCAPCPAEDSGEIPGF